MEFKVVSVNVTVNQSEKKNNSNHWSILDKGRDTSFSELTMAMRNINQSDITLPTAKNGLNIIT